MVVLKWSDKVEGLGEFIYAPLYRILYKEENKYLVPLSVTDTDVNMNCFTWSNEYNDWIVPNDHYIKDFKN